MSDDYAPGTSVAAIGIKDRDVEVPIPHFPQGTSEGKVYVIKHGGPCILLLRILSSLPNSLHLK